MQIRRNNQIKYDIQQISKINKHVLGCIENTFQAIKNKKCQNNDNVGKSIRHFIVVNISKRSMYIILKRVCVYIED